MIKGINVSRLTDTVITIISILILILMQYNFSLDLHQLMSLQSSYSQSIRDK